MPFGGIQPGDHIELTCQYLQPLNYYKRGYAILLPLYFREGTIVEDKRWDEVVKVHCKINAVSPTTKVCSVCMFVR